MLPDGLRTGVEDIDRDHARLYALSADFRDATTHTEIAPDKLRDAMIVLIDHCVSHFRREEALMREVEYPIADYNAHRTAHMRLWRTCLDLNEACEKADYDPVCGVRIATMIYAWLEHHVEVWDRAFIDFMRTRSPHAA